MLLQGTATHIPLKDNTIDSVITDPPYELGFMGKKWDSSGVAFQVDTWKEVLRVMKPGATMFCFGGTRTSHRLICAIEDAGFEIRDKIMWLYGSGFPKSSDISKAIDYDFFKAEFAKGLGRKPTKAELENGWGTFRRIIGKRTDGRGRWELKCNRTKGDTGIGHADGSKQQYQETIATTPEAQAWEGQGTALKPAYEDIVIAIKPCDGTFAQNALKWGCAGLNIDGGRIGFKDKADETEAKQKNRHADFGSRARDNKVYGADTRKRGEDGNYDPPGRWPANVILDEEAAELLDRQSGDSGNLKFSIGKDWADTKGMFTPGRENTGIRSFGDKGGASRFFYCAKASRAERNAGLEERPQKMLRWSSGNQSPGTFQAQGTDKYAQNYHPTVKPLALIEYLVRLGTRPGYVVLDPFVGSGTTKDACEKLNVTCIGIDLSFEYLHDIAKPRTKRPLQRELLLY